MLISGAYLPGDDASHEHAVIATYDDVRVTAPVLSATDIDDVCRQLLAARERLADVPVARVIAAVDSAARQLVDHTGTARAQALAGLTAISGFSAPMAAQLLDRAALDWTRPALERLVHVELGSAAAIEGFVHRTPGVRTRAVAPPLAFHVFSGNVPGVSVTSIVRSLLVRSAVFGKSALGEPVLAPIFARLLAEADPVVAACAAVTYWPGGDEVREAAVLEHANLVVHYGTADAIASLRGRAGAAIRFVEHGPRISFALIGPAALGAAYARGDNADPGDAHADAAVDLAPAADLAAEADLAAAPDLAAEADLAAADLAAAVATFDQQGCVSPQVAFVIGTEDAAAAFAARVADQLQRVQNVLPRGRLERAEAAAIRELRTRAEFDIISGGNVRVWEGPDLAYTIILSSEPDAYLSCLNRTLIVRPVSCIDDVVDSLRPLSRFLQTAGIAGFAEPELTQIATRLAGIGVSRTTSIAAMPWPPVTWHHDGRGPLNELIRWVDLEDPDQAGHVPLRNAVPLH